MAGARKSSDPARSITQIERFASGCESVSFDDAAADIYGEIRADLERIGQPIGPNDLLIAAIALVHGLVLVTNNQREFTKVPQLICEDWAAS